MLPTKRTIHMQQVLMGHHYSYHHNQNYHVNSKLLMKSCDLDGSNRTRKIIVKRYMKLNLNKVVHLKQGKLEIVLWQLYDQDYYLKFTLFEYKLVHQKFVASFMRCHVTIEAELSTKKSDQKDLLMLSNYDDRLVLKFSC